MIENFQNLDRDACDEEFGTCCDEFTEAARRFAAVILEERVRRSFAATPVNEVAGSRNVLRTPESYSEKLYHVQRIREWLRPWNLEFADATTEVLYGLHVVSERASGDMYELLSDKVNTRAAHPADLLKNPRLVSPRADVRGR